MLRSMSREGVFARWYTETLYFKKYINIYISAHRPVEAGVMFIGHHASISATMTIPPGQEEWIVNGHCSQQCTEKGMDEPVTVIGAMLHAHMLGKNILVY